MLYGTSFVGRRVQGIVMAKKIVRKKSIKATFAGVKNEMAEPRMAKSARHETVGQELSRLAREAAKV